MKKIKLFIGGVVNVNNAQNINCRSLIKYLDKDKFEITALQSKRKKILKDLDVSYIVIYEPIKIFKYFAFFLGIIKSDICYFPKTECISWCFFLCKLLNKKKFRTIESIIDERLTATLNKSNKSYIIKDYKRTENLFSITKFMKSYNYSAHAIESENNILYLGIDDNIKIKESTFIRSEGLKNVIIIGHDLKRKGVDEFLELAKIHPDLIFNIVGGNEESFGEKTKKKYGNVNFYGPQSSEFISNLLTSMDLMVLPSHSEGFPKVILECAANGVPSLVYSSYGATEWIKNNHNGFVANNKSEFFDCFMKIKNDPNLLFDIKNNLRGLVNQFRWSKQISNWEVAIEKVYNS